jgi:hypothetical protein
MIDGAHKYLSEYSCPSLAMDSNRSCPEGTKLWVPNHGSRCANLKILHLGTLEADEAYVLRHANAHKHYSENKPRRTRKLPINAALIQHPEEGLILFDTGAAQDIEKVEYPSRL